MQNERSQHLRRSSDACRLLGGKTVSRSFCRESRSTADSSLASTRAQKCVLAADPTRDGRGGAHLAMPTQFLPTMAMHADPLYCMIWKGESVVRGRSVVE